MGLQIIVRRSDFDRKTLANLDEVDLIKVSRTLQKAVINSFKPSDVIIVVSSAPKESDIQDRSDLAWDTFKILYIDLKWNLMRCLDEFSRIFNRRLSDRNWDVAAEEGQGMWVAPDQKE